MPFNSHSNDHIEIKPRFKLISSFPQHEVFMKITDALPKQKFVEAQVKGNHIFLRIPKENQHYWSPTMEVVVEELEDDKTKAYIRCLVGPKHSIWVMLMFFYVAVGVTTFFGGLYELAKWNLGEKTMVLWILPVAIILFAIIYGTTKYGQKRGRDQSLYLASFLYHAINDNHLIRL